MEDETRIQDLLSALTVEEKISLCTGQNFWQTKAVERLGIKRFKLTDGPRGIAWHSSGKRATAFPPGIALAATWDRTLAERFGQAMGAEARAAGCGVVLGPAVNICRTPVNGRTFEYLTEDPYLNRELAVPVVQGIQSNRIAACIKHYAANNQEKHRMKTDVVISERALREIYLPVFEAAVTQGDAWSVMAAYNAVQGLAACENPDLLRSKLREEYGFRGFAVSDWFAVRRTKSAASVVKAGLNLEMPGKGTKLKSKNLQRAFDAGEVSEADLDDNLAGLLRVMLLTGHLDEPIRSSTGKIVSTTEHQDLAREIAAAGITLLKNENQALPLKPDQLGKVAVLGPKARKRNCLPLWGGSSAVWPPFEITPWQGLQEKLKGRCELVRSARDADVALLFLGLSHRPGHDSEVMDRKSLDLPPKQVALLRKTLGENPNTIVVLISGSPVTMDWADEVPAIVEAWYPGMTGGHAIADVLFGDINPGGKLPVSFPRRLEDSPAHRSERSYPGDGSTVHYDEGIFVGYRHFDQEDIEPLFPFGHGLSYTNFSYTDLQLSAQTLNSSDKLDVSLQLTNSGELAGTEVVQLYISNQDCSQPRPPRELKGFSRVQLQPGESRRVNFALTGKDLACYHEGRSTWVTDPGRFTIEVGASSRDIRLEAEFQYRGDASPSSDQENGARQ